jgi:DNA-binding Xre family transcriptional regulator
MPNALPYDYRKDVKPDCIITKRTLHRSGYAQVNRLGTVNYEHRLVYAAANNLSLADIRNKVIRHKCDCRACINPAHLELGTLEDNANDTAERGRARGLSRPGSTNPAAKLSDAAVNAIRSDRRLTYQELADKYGTSKSTIARIKNNQAWKRTQDDVTANTLHT